MHANRALRLRRRLGAICWLAALLLLGAVQPIHAQTTGVRATHPDRLSAESAETHYRQALALAEPRGMRPLVAHCHLGLCNLYRRMGNRQEGRSHLGTATAMYCEMEMRFWLEQAGEQINELN